MGAACLIIAVAALVYSVNKERNLFYPGIYMYGIWAVIMTLNSLHLFGIFPASNQAYGMALIGLLSYIMGASLAKATARRKKAGNFDIPGYHPKVRQINYGIVYALLGLSIIFAVIDIAVAGKYLLSGHSLAQVRRFGMQTFEDATNPMLARRSFIEQTLRVLVTSPFRMALCPLCAVDFFFGRREKKLLLLVLFLLVTGVISGGGGRLGIVTTLFSFLFAFSMYQTKYRYNRREQKSIGRKLRLICAAGFFAIILLTTLRGSTKIFREAYYYFALCMPLLSHWLPTISKYPHTYGMMSFFGVTRIPFLVLEKLGLFSSDLYERCYQYILQANTFQTIGMREANSFVTPYYYLFIDGGYVGIVVGYLIIGFVVTRFYQKVLRSYNLRDMYLLIMFNIGLFDSFIRLEFCSTNYAIAVLCVGVLIRKHAVKEALFEERFVAVPFQREI